MAKILLVDDDRHNQLILQQLLVAEGYQVALADNGQLGLEVARRELPDLIISDILMPEMNGFRLCLEVKQDSQLSRQPFVFYTATFVEQEDEDLAMSLGASRFVIKPKNNQQFLRIIREVLDDYHLGRLEVPQKPPTADDQLLRMYESSMARKLEQTIERLRKERQALKLNAQRLKEAQQIAHLGHWELNLKDRQLRWSDEIYRILGAKPQEFPAAFEHFLQLVCLEDRELVRQTFDAALSRMTPFSLDCRLWLANGLRYVQLRGQTQCDEQGQPSYAIGTLQELTAAKEAEIEKLSLQNELFQAQKLESLGRLAGGVAHDFNNMLTAISGNAQLIGLRLPDEDPLRRYLDVIQDATQKAAGLVRQLLGFSRRQINLPKQLNLNLVILEITRMLERVIGEKIKIETDLDPQACVMLADQSQLEQVIMNLAINARDAMPEGGTLSLSTSNRHLTEPELKHYPGLCRGDYLLLKIADTGFGISPDHQKLIFDPFFTTKAEDHGTGLGLATVYNVVKQHQGHIWVESHPQNGTVFNILLPCSGTFCPMAPEERETVRFERGNETLLLVEDEAMVREMMCTGLEELGYQVYAAANGMEAEALFADHPEIELLLTDVVLPLKGGCELAAALQQENPELQVLYMSGHTLKTVMEQEGLASEVNFINKPVTIDALAQAVRRALDD